MAKGLFEGIIKDENAVGEFEVDSAGIYAFEGDLASKNAIEALKEYNFDITNHKAKRLTKEIAESADFIFTMTENHKQQIINMFPEVQNKTYTLLEYAYLNEDEGKQKFVDISDPFGLPLEYYKESAGDIYSALKKIYKKLKCF